MNLKAIEAAVIGLVAQPINSSLTNIQSNPTAFNAAAQLAALQADMLAVIPALETLGLKDGAALLQEKLNGYIASLNPPTVPPAGPATPAAPAA